VSTRPAAWPLASARTDARGLTSEQYLHVEDGGTMLVGVHGGSGGRLLASESTSPMATTSIWSLGTTKDYLAIGVLVGFTSASACSEPATPRHSLACGYGSRE
jgi:hypothetical protein